MYRPLSNNELIAVSKRIYEDRGLSGGLAESMFMAYTAKALHEDTAEYDVFVESEKERLGALSKNVAANFSVKEEPLEFLIELNNVCSSDGQHVHEPKNPYELYFGDESVLNPKYKRLRVLFHNSSRYRKQVLTYFTNLGVVANINDLNHVEQSLKDFTTKFPGTRQGVISDYEKFFGDATGFSYELAMERELFLSKKDVLLEYLKRNNLPVNWGIENIKIYLKEQDASISVAF